MKAVMPQPIKMSGLVQQWRIRCTNFECVVSTVSRRVRINMYLRVTLSIAKEVLAHSNAKLLTLSAVFRCRISAGEQRTVLRASAIQFTNMSTAPKTLTLDNLNPHIKSMEYAVRGPILIRAAEIEKELEQVLKKKIALILC